MDIKKKTKEELETRIHELERLIAKKGVGSKYLQRAEKVQRNVNFAIFFGAVATLLGLTAWAFARSHKEEDEE